MPKPFHLRDHAALLHRATWISLALIVLWGFVMTLAQIMPFWIDEWRIIYNLKTKSAAELFGPLYFTQQFPRVYLVLLKGFTSAFDYSYFALRLPAYCISVCSIFLAWRLMQRIYGAQSRLGYLFVLIVLTSPPFIIYLVQIKQYEMEIFLSLAGIGQLLCLEDVGAAGVQSKRHYALLCLSFAIAPFFSYTYPIVVTPLGILLLIKSIGIWRSAVLAVAKRRLLLQWIPLIICAVSIALFYVIDVQQVMHDSSMQCFWQEKMMKGNCANARTFAIGIWNFFGSVGSGYVFQIIFSILGLTAFVYTLAKSRLLFSAGHEGAIVLKYAVTLISIVLILFMAGMLPLGEPRLNAFTFPAVAAIIVYLLQGLRARGLMKLSTGIGVVLYAGLLGSVITAIINSFTGDDYRKTMRIYAATEDAVIYAQAKGLPVFITPGIAYPYDILHDSPCLSPIDAAAVLKTFPAYKVRAKVQVVSISSLSETSALPKGRLPAVVGDGMAYRVVTRPGDTAKDFTTVAH